MLFGVKTEGQLGGRNELVEGYELFKATYVNDRVRKVERMINYLGSFNGVEGMELIPVEPITERLSEQALLQIMTQDELREKAGLQPLEKPADVVGPNPQPDEQPQLRMGRRRI
jgi:hypothetical protein